MKIDDSPAFIRRTAVLFTITYMVSYITRTNYGAIISELVNAMDASRTQLSVALTGSFITYGAGQLLSGLLGDRFSPKKLVLAGLCTTSCMNALLTLCSAPGQMVFLWCVNGLAQAFMWPPMVKLMSALPEKDYPYVSVRVSWGASFGTIAVYLLSPLLISFAGWRAVFLFSAACGALMAFVWARLSYDTPVERAHGGEKAHGGKSPLFSPLVLWVMGAIILQGMLRDGVTTWMPSYIGETYSLSSGISILTGVTLPVFGILFMQLAALLYTKRLKNPLLCAGTIFSVGAAASLGLRLFSGGAAGASVFLAAILAGCMHGVNFLLITQIPPFFKKYGNVSTVSGVLNSCVYIGSALSTYGVAAISEIYGWNAALTLWSAVAFAGTAICLLCAAPWKRKMGE